MRTLRVVREDEAERRRVAAILGYADEACCECNEYTLGKENPDGDPVSPLICQTCGNRQLPAHPDYGDDVHTVVPLPDGIQGLDLPVAKEEDIIRLRLRRWLRLHLDAAKWTMVAIGTVCLALTLVLILRALSQYSGDIDLAFAMLAIAILFFGLWYMLEVAGDHLRLDA